MGGSSYSSSTFDSTIGAATKAGRSVFTHNDAVDAGTAEMKVHADLDPAFKNKAKQIIRESRDSEAHPESVAVVILFDVTGSLTTVPRIFVERLGSLMSLITKKGYLEHPQILFGAIGDAYSDEVPLQVGQFESGNEMDKVLQKVVLEGNGGSQYHESYDLGLYFMARHTAMDCLEKRGKKGYLFILGDELLYPNVSRAQVKAIIGADIQADIPIADILAEVADKFEITFIMPKGSNYWDRKDINDGLRAIWGQSFLKLEDPAAVSELIAMTIGINEGFDVKSIEADLIKNGSTKRAAKSASTAITPYIASTGTLAKRAARVEGTLTTSGADSVERL